MIRPSPSSSSAPAAAAAAIGALAIRRSLLHTSRPMLLATATAADVESSATTGRSRSGKKLNRVQAWLASEGKVFQQVHTGGSNYVSRRGDQPFPMNPLFRPVPPLADRVRNDIFTQATQAGGKSVAELAASFRLSEARIKAIIKLKQHERTLVQEQGFQLQHAFREGMERMLGSLTRRPGGLDVAYVKPIRADPPYLLALDEDAVFEKEDALRMLKAGSAHGTDSAAERKAFKEKSKKKEPVVFVKETKRGKMVFNLNADVTQGHVKRVYKTELKSY
ncbi:eukaryotic mitochondrial regulator protein-domain-containing protein [Catenaria anguillulae PL171]|uniref:Eukaryotic mitochondrial regulator protein-domain-containing protein n=1 Tax=Catenaria anguillulae PL171 TaxID=765915 RepID=A0A1Y2HC83_9FUNG|nr:eukaryotic mitochondrial regulator protein-domain-containing protein [Catenaria anguillulae PL171]